MSNVFDDFELDLTKISGSKQGSGVETYLNDSEGGSGVYSKQCESTYPSCIISIFLTYGGTCCPDMP